LNNMNAPTEHNEVSPSFAQDLEPQSIIPFSSHSPNRFPQA
jgi:hypothetical protein